MKKIILTFVLMAGFAWKGEAQHFIASFGVQHNWGVPYHISDIVYDHYYDYDWVHVNRVSRGGFVTFDFVLQRGNTFVELRLGRRGRIISSRYVDHYPLHNHVCGSYCGFHADYYNTYHVTCNSHRHHRHNHIVYRPGVRRYGYSYHRNHRYHRQKTYHYNRGYQYSRDNHNHGQRNGRKHYNSNTRSRNNNSYRKPQAYSRSGEKSRVSERGKRGRGNSGNTYSRRD